MQWTSRCRGNLALPTSAFAHWTEHTRLLQGKDRDLASAVLSTNPNTAFFHQFLFPVKKKKKKNWCLFGLRTNQNKREHHLESWGFRDIFPSRGKLWLTVIDIITKTCNIIYFSCTSASPYFQRNLHTPRTNKAASANPSFPISRQGRLQHFIDSVRFSSENYTKHWKLRTSV